MVPKVISRRRFASDAATLAAKNPTITEAKTLPSAQSSIPPPAAHMALIGLPAVWTSAGI